MTSDSERDEDKLDLSGWPMPGDRLIVAGNAFGSGAFLGSFHRQFRYFAPAFKLGGDKLVEAALSEHHANRDRLAWPALAVYRQSIELFLKGAISDLQDAQLLQEEAPLTHDLSMLFVELKRLIIDFYGSADMLGLDAVEAMLNELAAADTNSQAFRYPRDRMGNKFSSVPATIDLVELKASMDRLALFFDCLSTDIRYRADASFVG